MFNVCLIIHFSISDLSLIQFFYGLSELFYYQDRYFSYPDYRLPVQANNSTWQHLLIGHHGCAQYPIGETFQPYVAFALRFIVIGGTSPRCFSYWQFAFLPDGHGRRNFKGSEDFGLLALGEKSYRFTIGGIFRLHFVLVGGIYLNIHPITNFPDLTQNSY